MQKVYLVTHLDYDDVKVLFASIDVEAARKYLSEKAKEKKYAEKWCYLQLSQFEGDKETVL